MSATVASDGVAAYAAAVRDHLRALDTETLDDLTGGLEADLADALADQLAQEGDAAAAVADADVHDLTARFGPAAAYAEELRAAAGIELPATEPRRSRRRVSEVLADAVAGWALDVRALAERHRWFAATLDLLVALRPVWWVARGWVLFALVQGLFLNASPWGVPNEVDEWLVLGVLVLASVQWGRGAVAQRRGWRGLCLFVSGVAAILLPFFVGIVVSSSGNALDVGSYDQGYSDGFDQGMNAAGDPAATDPERAAALVSPEVTNLFVYGPDGEPVDGAQIVDQDGQPIVLTDELYEVAWDPERLSTYVHNGLAVPSSLVTGAPLNVFPYRFVEPDGVDLGTDGPALDPAFVTDPRWPAGSLLPVPADDSPIIDPSPGATQTADGS